MSGVGALAARLRPALLLALLLALLPLGGAQPYAAGGGFGRPLLKEERAATATVGVAVADDGGVTTVWAGREGIWRQDGADGAPVLLASTDDVRIVDAAYVGGDLVVTWVSRDRRTGAYHHMALVDGRPSELFVDALILDLEPFDWGGEPWAAALFRSEGEGQLRLVPLAGGEHRVVYSTELTQRGLDYLPLEGGELWFGWVEGRNERGDFGLISEWDALVARLPGPDAELVGPVSLGEANVEDERRGVALLTPADASAQPGILVMWPDEDAALRLTEVSAAGGGLAPHETGPPVGTGRPLGGAWPHLHWVDDASVRRLDVTTGAVENVAWSPVTIEGARFDTNEGRAVGAAEPVTAIAWYGRAQGATIEVYSTSDREPMALTFADRLAALMNWNPWHMWDEAIGQLLTALLVGVMAATFMVPAMMLLSAALGRLFRSNRRALRIGLLIGALFVVGGAWLVSRGMGAAGTGPMGAWSVLLAAAVVGVLLGWLIGRRGDREPSATLTLVASMTTFGGTALWAFLTYKQWAPLVGLS